MEKYLSNIAELSESLLGEAPNSRHGKFCLCILMPPIKFLSTADSFPYILIRLCGDNIFIARLITLLIAAGGFGLVAPSAIAQSAGRTAPVRDESGTVRVDNNAFNLNTGPLINQSNIPLPSQLPVDTQERQALPVDTTKLAPNNVQIRTDMPYIDRAFNDALTQEAPGSNYTLQGDTLTFTSRFNLNYREGNHGFGEGIQVRVLRPDGTPEGTEVSSERVFVRGDRIRFGPDGTELPRNASITATYGVNDVVELRVLNLRQNNQATPSESGIYFNQAGNFIVEDLPNGGDLDFDDGDYVALPGGRGVGVALRDNTNITVSPVIEEIPLAPETRQEEFVETDTVEDLQQTVTQVEEQRSRGTVELPDDALSTRIGHATGISTDDDEQLVYNRYAAAGEVRLGSDGLGLTGQLSPLAGNPATPPTLLTGNITFDPTVGDNEAGLTATAGITQFFTRTHRVATDILGVAIVNPDPDGPLLVEPIGLFNNRRWVGYVPATPGRVVQGDPIVPVNGIVNLSADQAVVIAPPNPQQVGPGNAAYTDNVGGLLLERPDASLSFVPQWTKNGYAQEPISLGAGEVSRIIYALVPQQPGQALQLGQTYAVTSGADGYRIADGNFRIISADRQPQNFDQEMADVYAVEDTLPSGNAANTLFNGIQGAYAEVPGGNLISTVDVTRSAEADARVGNALIPQETILGAVGQRAYVQTTRAGGLYIGGALTGGIGNQRDTVFRTTTTVDRAISGLLTRRTVNTFSTPLTQITSSGTETTETTRTTGAAAFDINSAGELINVTFVPQGEPTLISTTSREVPLTTTVRRGDEALTDSTTQETIEPTEVRILSVDQGPTTVEEDSYPNLSPVRGELALGGVFNFGNTPWTAAANTVRAELFTRDTVFGRGGGFDTGLRAEVVFHPFGEVQRDAYQYDVAGNTVAVYQTEPMLDASGQQMMAVLTSADKSVEVPVNQFAVDEGGDRLLQQVGTGRSRGPGIYLRLEDVLNDNDSGIVAGGIQYSF